MRCSFEQHYLLRDLLTAERHNNVANLTPAQDPTLAFLPYRPRKFSTLI